MGRGRDRRSACRTEGVFRRVSPKPTKVPVLQHSPTEPAVGIPPSGLRRRRAGITTRLVPIGPGPAVVPRRDMGQWLVGNRGEGIKTPPPVGCRCSWSLTVTFPVRLLTAGRGTEPRVGSSGLIRVPTTVTRYGWRNTLGLVHLLATRVRARDALTAPIRLHMQLLTAHLAHHHGVPGRVHVTPRDRLPVGRLREMPRLGTPHAYGLAGVPRSTIAGSAPAHLGVDHWRIFHLVATQRTLPDTCSHTRNVTLNGTGMPGRWGAPDTGHPGARFKRDPHVYRSQTGKLKRGVQLRTPTTVLITVVAGVITAPARS